MRGQCGDGGAEGLPAGAKGGVAEAWMPGGAPSAWAGLCRSLGCPTACMVPASLLWGFAAGLLAGCAMVWEGVDARGNLQILPAMAAVWSTLFLVVRSEAPRVTAAGLKGFSLGGCLLFANLLLALALVRGGDAGPALAWLCAGVAGTLGSGALALAVAALPARVRVALRHRGRGCDGVRLAGRHVARLLGGCAFGAVFLGGACGALAYGATGHPRLESLAVGAAALNAVLAALVLVLRGASCGERTVRGRRMDESSVDSTPDRELRDLTAKKCALLCGTYGLSQREGEVAERMARGQTVPHMARELGISQNTVRMHSKHIYRKLAIHKRQELLDLLEQF